MKQTEGVKTLLGDPEKAIWKLSIPMIIAMSMQTIYNVVDAFWVSGLGKFALTAVGLFFPFFFMILALATGLGIGGGSEISRRIGSDDKEGADNVAEHTLILMIIIGVIVTIPSIIFIEDIFRAMGASQALGMAVGYSQVMFAGTLILMFGSIGNAILRSEGDAKRAMYALVVGSVLNIILDPIFIYTLNLGVPGAAYATVLSFSVSSLLLFYWLFIKKDTYVSFRLKCFKFKVRILKDIFKVGLPASFMQLSMSATMFITNFIILWISGEIGVAVFTTGWRITTLAIMPLIGISTAVVAVSGATYGMKAYDKLEKAYHYAIKNGLKIEIVIGIITFALAPYIAAVFTTAEGSQVIQDDLTLFLRIIIFYYPSVALGMFSSSMFQGTGKGFYALLVTLLRTIIITPPLQIVFALVIGMNLEGIWVGIVTANILGGLIAYIWGNSHIKKLNDLKK